MKKRPIYSFKVDDLDLFKKRCQAFFNTEKHFFFLNSNATQFKHSSFDAMIAVGCLFKISCDYGAGFKKLESFRQDHRDWMFGWLGYDFKNELEDLCSAHKDHVEFPDLTFIVPEHVILMNKEVVTIHSFAPFEECKALFLKINEQITSTESIVNDQDVSLEPGYSRDEYLHKAQNFLNHIQRGDIYEANFCTQFTASDVKFDAFKAYRDLNKISEPPFSALVRCGAFEIVSASPERYLKKSDDIVLSQPIKGTSKRFVDPALDNNSKKFLFNDPKERSENVMIVDLVRNDLSKTAMKGTVEVKELYGIYSFKQVHHMISTVQSRLKHGLSELDVIKTTFPMGSMTGAPKVSAMQIIEENENFKRGLYSGALGYFTPQGDFDFNVVIRSILYNSRTQKLSFAVGSALTINASPEKEYEECLLKAKALFETLELQGINFKESHAPAV